MSSKPPASSRYDRTESAHLPNSSQQHETHQLYDVNKSRNNRPLKKNVSFNRNLSISRNNLNNSYDGHSLNNQSNKHRNNSYENDLPENEEYEENIEEVEDEDEDNEDGPNGNQAQGQNIYNLKNGDRNGAVSTNSNWNFSKSREVSPKMHWNFNNVVNHANPASNKEKRGGKNARGNNSRGTTTSFVSRKQQTDLSGFVDPQPFDNGEDEADYSIDNERVRRVYAKMMRDYIVEIKNSKTLNNICNIFAALLFPTNQPGRERVERVFYLRAALFID